MRRSSGPPRTRPILTCARCCIALLRSHLRALGDAALKFGTEVTDQTLDRPRRGIAKSTDDMAFDLFGHFDQLVDLLYPCIAGLQALHHPPHPAGAFAARRALTAALMLVEIGETRNHAHEISGLVHHDHGR